jgi:hypothetical protein
MTGYEIRQEGSRFELVASSEHAERVILSSRRKDELEEERTYREGLDYDFECVPTSRSYDPKAVLWDDPTVWIVKCVHSNGDEFEVYSCIRPNAEHFWVSMLRNPSPVRDNQPFPEGKEN